jgi:uncharacterized protein (TIGR03000 family)
LAALVLAASLLGQSAGEARAWWGRGPTLAYSWGPVWGYGGGYGYPWGGYGYPWGQTWGYGGRAGYPWGLWPTWGYGSPMVYSYYQAWYMPLPAYGIMPQPLATYNMLQGGTLRSSDDFRARDYYEPPARMRTSMYPAVPNERGSGVRVEDLRRVRFDIVVPFENAVVFFDGTKTTQSGQRRIYQTPPLEEDKQYVVTIRVEFNDKAGERRVRSREFTVVAGQSVTHAFIE